MAGDPEQLRARGAAPAGDGSLPRSTRTRWHTAPSAPTTRGCRPTASCGPPWTCSSTSGCCATTRSRGLLSPVDPAAIQSQVVVPLGRAGRRAAHRVGPLGGRVQRARPGLPDLAAGRGQPDHRDPRPGQHQQLHPRRGQRLARRSCSPRSRTAGARRPRWRRPRTATSRRCERGVRMRTLYQHSARHSPATREYVADIVARGAEVRTLDEFFRRLIVVDRQVAVVPGLRQPPRRDRDPRQVADRLPRGHLRAVLGAGPAVQPQRQPGRAQHRRRRAGDDDPAARRGAQRPGQRQAARRQHPHLRRATSPPSRTSTDR